MPSIRVCLLVPRRVSEIVAPCLHQRVPLFEQVRPRIRPFDATHRMCKRRFGHLAWAPEHSPHQSRNDERNPCGTAVIPFSQTTLLMVESDSGRSVTDGNTRFERSLSSSAWTRIALAPLDSGTRCARYTFIRSPGIAHTSFSRSISSHVASRTSPERQAVNTRNSNASTVAQYASLARTLVSESPAVRAGRP